MLQRGQAEQLVVRVSILACEALHIRPQLECTSGHEKCWAHLQAAGYGAVCRTQEVPERTAEAQLHRAVCLHTLRKACAVPGHG